MAVVDAELVAVMCGVDGLAVGVDVGVVLEQRRC